MVVPLKLRSFVLYIPSVVRQYVHHLQPRLWKTCRKKKQTMQQLNAVLFNNNCNACYVIMMFFIAIVLVVVVVALLSQFFDLWFVFSYLYIIDNFVNLRAKILSAFQSSAFIHFYIVFLFGTLAVTNRKADADSSTRI